MFLSRGRDDGRDEKKKKERKRNEGANGGEGVVLEHPLKDWKNVENTREGTKLGDQSGGEGRVK